MFAAEEDMLLSFKKTKFLRPAAEKVRCRREEQVAAASMARKENGKGLS